MEGFNNTVSSLLFGGVIPRGFQNTTRVPTSKYTHYSILSTVEDNWNLTNLGGGDVDAEPFW